MTVGKFKKLLKKFKAVNRALFNSNYEDIKMTVNEINTRLDYFLHLENKLNTILSHLSDQNSYINMNISTIRHGLSVPFWRQEIRANELISVLKPNIFLDLDQLEDYQPHRPAEENEYQRQQISVFDLNHQPFGLVWVYLMDIKTVEFYSGVLIPDGCWKNQD
jgi:hypothetical protein